jgi:hypothetical protein
MGDPAVGGQLTATEARQSATGGDAMGGACAAPTLTFDPERDLSLEDRSAYEQIAEHCTPEGLTILHREIAARLAKFAPLGSFGPFEAMVEAAEWMTSPEREQRDAWWREEPPLIRTTWVVEDWEPEFVDTDEPWVLGRHGPRPVSRDQRYVAPTRPHVGEARRTPGERPQGRGVSRRARSPGGDDPEPEPERDVAQPTLSVRRAT